MIPPLASFQRCGALVPIRTRGGCESVEMKNVTRTRLLKLGAVGLAMAIAGCPNPRTTRFPTLAPQNPYAERAASQRHDPFPIDDLGPETNVRPPDFAEPRTQPRRAQDGRLYQGLPNSGVSGPPIPSSGYRYPDAVPQ